MHTESFGHFSSISVCGQLNADYAFAMDTSGSILDPEFEIMKDFINQVIDFLLIGPNLTHVGLIDYSNRARLQFDFLQSFEKEEIKSSVEAVNRTQGLTRIDLALKVASEELFKHTGGMRDTSRKVKRVSISVVKPKPK